MSAGELRERVAFETRTSQSDSYGNEVGGFLEQFRRPARIQPYKGFGNEAVQAARLTGTQPMIIRVRYDSSTSIVNSDWRVRDLTTGTVYNIRSSANMDEHRAYIDFLCESGEASG